MRTIKPRPNCLGKFAAIRVDGLTVYGTPIDFVAGQPMKPKRIRIQRGLPSRHGDVVQPHEYEFRWWADQEED